MPNTPTQVADDVIVKIEYSLAIDGEILDSSAEEGPLEYLQGHDNLVPGLEKALTGMEIGDELKVTVEPDEGYGVYDDEAVSHIPRLEMPSDIPLEVGTELVMEDDDGSYISAVITWVGADEVKLDFNHPLAGRSLDFEIKIIGLREASAEELEHGHVHASGHHHD